MGATTSARGCVSGKTWRTLVLFSTTSYHLIFSSFFDNNILPLLISVIC